MACKNDESWEGAYVYKDNCVKWDDLTDLRKDFNRLWDLLKKEEKEDGDKYGYRGEEQSVKEQIEPLATIGGFFGLRYDATQTLDEIYFYITEGTILDRLKWLGTQYSYDHAPQGTNFGPWIVWLKDQCHACTVFRFVNADAKFARSLVCNYNYIANIDNDAWRLQCIWSSNGCNYPGIVLGDWEDYCHINWDWRDPEYYRRYLSDVADKLFLKGPICVPFDDPCTVTRRWCCGLYAIAHYTEEDCNFNGPCEEYPGYVCRRLKFVSLGVTTNNPGEEVHGPFISDQGAGAASWDLFFCCPNQITGGQLKGYVTQKISAIHLTDIWDRANKMVGGKTLRKCFYNQCKYYEGNEKKYRWLHKESVPMYASGSTADIMDRKDGPCENCDKAAVGASICACNFNDINAMLDEYNAATCSCQNEGENKGKTLTNFGDVSTCNCCKAKCCCDCQCSETLTKEECEKKQCKKNGPKWVGIYEKGQSKDDKKLGDAKPCGCYEGGSEPDPPFPDTSCMEVCGKTSACCVPKEGGGECCEDGYTKCACDDAKGKFKGFRASDGATWKKGDPVLCSDDPPPCQGVQGQCCVEGTCDCNAGGPGSACTPEDGCYCDSRCYTDCNDCCDFPSARACCSGYSISSLFVDIDDEDTSVMVLIDQIFSDLSKVYDDYNFITNAFDLLLLSSIYIHENESIKITNYYRYVYLNVLLDFRNIFIEKGANITEEDLSLFFEQNSQTMFYYSEIYRRAKSTDDPELTDAIYMEFESIRSTVLEKFKQLNLLIME